MMMRFHQVPDGAVIIRSRGMFKQADIFVRDSKLYAGIGSGFVRLHANVYTSQPKVMWDDIDPGEGAVFQIGHHLGWEPSAAPVLEHREAGRIAAE